MVLIVVGLVLSFAGFVATNYYEMKYKKKKEEERANIYTDVNGHPIILCDTKIKHDQLKPGYHIFTKSTGSIDTHGLASSQSSIGSIRQILDHHGVYLGIIDGEHKVADFGRDESQEYQEYPVTCTLNEFLRHDTSATLYVRHYTSGRINSPEETIDMARDICSSKQWDKYHVVNNNCEHFATYLKTCKKGSLQVYNWL